MRVNSTHPDGSASGSPCKGIMDHANATNDRAFEAEVRELPAGESAGPGGAYQVEIDKRTGEAKFAVDLDGLRYWLIVPPDGRIEDALAEVQRRTRLARGSRFGGTERGEDLVRALTDLVSTVQRAVGFAMSSSVQPATGAATGPYSTANLPPGVSARAFNDAVRKKRVRFAVVSGRNMVLATDWDHYVASCVKKAKPVRTNATDDELLASVGSRKGGRK